MIGKDEDDDYWVFTAPLIKILHYEGKTYFLILTPIEIPFAQLSPLNRN